MTVFGFCVSCRQDQSATETIRCSDCGQILIPPSWSKRADQYPWPERPEGWAPPKRKVVAGQSSMCGFCFKEFVGAARQEYCGSVCQSRARNIRRGAQKVEAVA